MKNSSQNPREKMALIRFGVVSWIEQKIREAVCLAQALREASMRPWPDENGICYALRTIEDWWYDYRKGGFEALKSPPRNDKGQSRKLTSGQKQWILKELQTSPGVKFKVLYTHWQQKGLAEDLPSLSTLYRFLRQEGYDSLSLKRAGLINGPTKAFEAPFVNDLWMVDFSPGPVLAAEGKAALKTQLCVLIDDHSRLIPYAGYYLKADTRAFHDTLKQAVIRRGIPLKLYTDQGGSFVSHHSRMVCANLGIRLLHAKPYHSWSKGKIERVIHTIQQGFEATLRINPPSNEARTLSQLNERLSQWIQQVYHLQTHSSTLAAPQQRYLEAVGNIRQVDPSIDINKLFFTSRQRTVRKDGTVRIDNRLFEVDLSLRALKVQLRFDPYQMDCVEVWYKDAFRGQARPVDLHVNSATFESRRYDR